MVSFLCGDDGSIGCQREVNPGVWHQVGLELCQVNIQSTIESERSGDGGHNLTYKSVEVGVCGSLNVEVPAADIVDGLVVDHEGTVRVLKSGVSGQNRVVWLDNRSRNLMEKMCTNLLFSSILFQTNDI